MTPSISLSSAGLSSFFSDAFGPRPPRAGFSSPPRSSRRRRARAGAAAAAAAPAAGRRLFVVVATAGVAALGAGEVVAGLLGEDRVDQVVLAKTAEAVDAELVGEQVEIGERGLRERGAIKYDDMVSPFGMGRSAPGRVETAAGNLALS
jgi:hypothetical protein